MTRKLNGLTRSELAHITNVKYYVIDYLRNVGALPIIKKGAMGRPTIYHPDCIEVINRHISGNNK